MSVEFYAKGSYALSQIYPHWNLNSKLNTKLRLELQVESSFKLEFQVELLIRRESVVRCRLDGFYALKMLFSKVNGMYV